MDNYVTKYQAETIPNISEVSTIQETIDVKIYNIKEKNIEKESIKSKTQSINNLLPSGISKTYYSKKCKILCIIICLIFLFILTYFILMLNSPCIIPKENLKTSVVPNSYMTNNTKEFDNNYS